MVQLSRRALLAAAGALPLASLAPEIIKAAQADAATSSPYRFFTAHEGAVVEAATARLVPGPSDDPLEALAMSPGAREANVTRYIDNLLSAFDHDPPHIFSSGPWSNRHLRPGDEREDYMADFVPLVERQLKAWTIRIKELQTTYRAGIKELDQKAGGDFTQASTETQDHILIEAADIRSALMDQTLEGMYSVPEYGGNTNQAGWHSISWRGDSAPAGYTLSEIEDSDGLDPVDPTGVVTLLLEHLPAATQRMSTQRWRFGG